MRKSQAEGEKMRRKRRKTGQTAATRERAKGEKQERQKATGRSGVENKIRKQDQREVSESDRPSEDVGNQKVTGLRQSHILVCTGQLPV